MIPRLRHYRIQLIAGAVSGPIIALIAGLLAGQLSWGLMAVGFLLSGGFVIVSLIVWRVHGDEFRKQGIEW